MLAITISSDHHRTHQRAAEASQSSWTILPPWCIKALVLRGKLEGYIMYTKEARVEGNNT